ncbi:nose resistant to fluoxetine protein 6 [Rhynchophorus ferrugineus]|uniref:nose resistant to fluoxetine protein 6 n=1 Tax=Rhynchophorus ferrugineus TaxID=354439 RepID=UPI003FCE530A
MSLKLSFLFFVVFALTIHIGTSTNNVTNDNNSDYTGHFDLDKVLNFFSSDGLRVAWANFKTKVSADCAKDVDVYLDGLTRADSWALKMDDASGKYSTGWFWGNQFWLGSQSLCEHIEPKSKTIVINSQNRSRVIRTASLNKLQPSSPSEALGYKQGPVVYTSAPPFSVAFYTMRLHINNSFLAEEKIMHLGLCLPFACTNDDVKTILEHTSSASTDISVDVLKVRSRHNRYSMGQDPTFIILCVVTAGMLCMLTLGTIFDYYLEHEKCKKVATITARYSVPTLRSTNGKSGIYVVNKNSSNDDNNNGGLPAIEVNASSSASSTHGSIIRMIVKEMILSFSVKANMKTICDKSVGSDTIPVLHGLKTISMIWVILGHTCIICFKYSDNMEFRRIIQKEFFFQTIINGAFSVDTFFFVSGLLVSFLYFRTNAKGKLDPLSKGKNGFVAGLLHFLGLMFYRFARLTAPYLFALGITEVSMKWFNSNSVFEVPALDHENCPNYWWRNLLYINTLFPVNEMCMLWSWYISDDTQFYAIGAVILILATRHFKIAASLLSLIAFSSWMTTGYIAYSNSHLPGTDDPMALFDKIYDKPWTRLGPYFIGMCTGWILFKKDCRMTMSKWTLTLGWCVSTGLLLSLVYGLYEANLSPLVGAAYSSLSHSAWALGLAWIVVACVTGYGGIVNKILSLPILYPFSRVTYCAYLIHPIIIRAMVMTTDSPLHLGSMITMVIFLGQTVASFGLSFILSLVFEAPIVSLLRIISKVVAHKKQFSDRTT